jgi:hypothetical protein
MFFGTVISRGKAKSTWNVKWMYYHNNVIKNITRTKLTVVEDGEEEKGLPDNVQLDEVSLDSDEGKGSPISHLLKKKPKILFVSRSTKT